MTSGSATSWLQVASPVGALAFHLLMVMGIVTTSTKMRAFSEFP